MKQNRFNPLTILHFTTLLNRAENHWPIERMKRMEDGRKSAQSTQSS